MQNWWLSQCLWQGNGNSSHVCGVTELQEEAPSKSAKVIQLEVAEHLIKSVGRKCQNVVEHTLLSGISETRAVEKKSSVIFWSWCRKVLLSRLWTWGMVISLLEVGRDQHLKRLIESQATTKNRQEFLGRFHHVQLPSGLTQPETDISP